MVGIRLIVTKWQRLINQVSLGEYAWVPDALTQAYRRESGQSAFYNPPPPALAPLLEDTRCSSVVSLIFGSSLVAVASILYGS
jgi:hypothetical protein